MESASSTEKDTDEAQSVRVSNYVSFGDSGDVVRKDKIESDGGTIIYTLDTRREFVPGEYLMKKLRGDNRIDTIIYHSSVDPDKIKNLLFHCNVGSNFREANYINRYDWLHERNWGDGKEKICFFVPEENLPKFKSSKRRRPSLWISDPFAFKVDLDSKKLEGDWIYGCLPQDINTGKYFALVVEEMYTNISLGGDDNNEVEPLLPELEGMPREDLKFDMNRLKVDATNV